MNGWRSRDLPEPGGPTGPPAVEFLRRAVKAMNNSHLKIGTICHSLWLFCAAPETLTGRKVTCAHNIMGDVENAGGTLVFYDDQLIDIYVDGNLITGRHPGVVEAFMKTFLEEIEKLAPQPVM